MHENDRVLLTPTVLRFDLFFAAEVRVWPNQEPKAGITTRNLRNRDKLTMLRASNFCIVFSIRLIFTIMIGIVITMTALLDLLWQNRDGDTAGHPHFLLSF